MAATRITSQDIKDGTVAEIDLAAGLYLVPTGAMMMWPVMPIPTGWLLCDGTAVSRATYATLFALMVRTSTVTVTIATPGVFTWNAHGLAANQRIKFSTSGALPTGITAGTTYFINGATLTANTFEVSTTQGGPSVATTGSQSGTHTAIHAPFGDGDGSTTFNVPDMGRRLPLGRFAGTPASSVSSLGAGVGGWDHTHSIDVTVLEPDATVEVQSGTGVTVATDLHGHLVTGGSTTGTGNPPVRVVNFIIRT